MNEEMLPPEAESELKIRQRDYIHKLITREIFKSEEQLQKRIEKETEKWFNDRINCGG